MKSAKNIFPLLVFPIMLFGCKKEDLLLKENVNFEGTWYSSNWDGNTGSGMKININAQSIFSFQQYENGTISKRIDGTATINNDKLIVEKKIGYKNYHIDIFPAYDSNGNYSMKLDGIVYVH